MKEVEYYYVIMSQRSFFENQVIEEILRERASYYSLRNRITDFWILTSPKFVFSSLIYSKLKQSNFYKKNEKLILSKDLAKGSNLEFYSCLISTDKEFIKWFELRIGYFENINNLENNEYVCDGLSGTLKINEENSFNILESNPTFLNPTLLFNKFKSSFNSILTKEIIKIKT